MADMLVAGIGRDRVIELTTKVAHFTRALVESPELPRILGDRPRGVVRNLIMLGSAGGSAAALLSWLADREPDPNWRWNLLAAIGFWDYTFEHTATMHTGSRSAAGLAQDISDVTGTVTEEDQYINEALTQQTSWNADFAVESPVAEDYLRRLLAMFQGGIDLRRSLVRRFPQNPLAHTHLGSFLGMVGKNFGKKSLVDEGVLECKIAAGLQPNWDNPAVEVGIILVNIGESETALRELERAESALPEPTPHLRFVKGYVLRTLERYPEALECLEAVIDERPDFAPAYDHASHCAFKSGDRIKGLRYAKEARMRGMYAAHRAWGNGVYSSRRRASAAPSDGL